MKKKFRTLTTISIEWNNLLWKRINWSPQWRRIYRKWDTMLDRLKNSLIRWDINSKILNLTKDQQTTCSSIKTQSILIKTQTDAAVKPDSISIPRWMALISMVLITTINMETSNFSKVCLEMSQWPGYFDRCYNEYLKCIWIFKSTP